MDTFEVLREAGMNKKGAAVVAALLDKGALSLSHISAETHINRPALYALLPSLVRDGLVFKVQNKKRILYRAESPKKILELYRSKQEELSAHLTRLAEVHELQSSERPRIKYFEGSEGITYVFDDIIESVPKHGTFYRYTSRTGNAQRFASTRYAKERDARGLERMVIASEIKAAQKPKKLERSIKVIPKEFDLFEDNISLVIYGNKTAYIDYGSQTAFIVESPKIARFQEKLFRLLYKKL
jgi:sugar-specific transcriptional regulator TrmB